MFTGLVKELGTIASITPNSEGKRIRIHSRVLLPEMEIDDSVNINGACQTAVEIGEDYFDVQAIHTTLQKTNFADLQKGDLVNLELALRLNDRLGGHLVQGHVNGTAKLLDSENQGKNYLLTFSLPKQFRPYILPEGSIALDGISLTVAHVKPDWSEFQISIIPHTWENTVLKSRKIGDKVNVEVDILAKYVENLIRHSPQEQDGDKSDMTFEWLKKQGF